MRQVNYNMPEGPAGFPRLFNIGPLSRATEEEVRAKWDECPESGKEHEICREIKRISLELLDNEGFIARCDTLEDINGGSCCVVTDFVLPEVDDVEVWKIGDGDHFWIHYNGRHYDAEVPTGVNDWRDLPIFGRIPPDTILEFTKMAADSDGRERPNTIEDTIEDVTEKRSRDGKT